MKIREIQVADAEAFSSLRNTVDAESQYMLFEADERKYDVEQEKKKLQSMLKSETSTIYVAQQDDELVGYLVAIGSDAKKKQHAVYLVIGVLEKYRGTGVGTALFSTLEEWANERSIHRIELTVATPNEGGLALYKKFGFEVEGLKRHSLLIDGEYVDEYYMSKLL
ncbi:GNAT family N-acetyltransferase [Guptibacillus algicola]|uniref:GNAT family N-acetyltransferase n=1 Tax=Guptibacillus algicola TaxID=225844 RepID=UPI001CD542DB|nr:GNAT family N-acetyltransferase [Alkalihalobacillus algicola]MCA0987596.1 GNAT family N-acetyltransferase [Alkalihalobacillus algicola]